MFMGQNLLCLSCSCSSRDFPPPRLHRSYLQQNHIPTAIAADPETLAGWLSTGSAGATVGVTAD
jgi:hypothetical protein